jgi:uncharacterized protein (TIGR02118 family)
MTTMFKAMWFARFRTDLPEGEAARYWTERHGPLCVTTDIERYEQNLVVGPLPVVSGVPDEEPRFDGYSVGWWPDRPAYEATLGRPEWDALVADGFNALDMPRLDGLIGAVSEHVVVDGPRAPFKAVWVVRFKPGIDREAARQHWRDVHGPLFPLEHIDRYVQNHVVGALVDGNDPVFDGFSECWFTDEAQFLRAVSSDAWAEAVADSANIFDASGVWGALVAERVMKVDGRPVVRS